MGFAEFFFYLLWVFMEQNKEMGNEFALKERERERTEFR